MTTAKTRPFRSVSILVDSPDNRDGLWQFSPARNSEDGKLRPGWVCVVECDGYVRICSREVAEALLVELRAYSHTEES